MGHQRELSSLTGLIILAVALYACAAPPPATTNASRAAEGNCVPVATWIVPADGHQRSRAEVLQRAAGGRFVLLGELHDNVMHHAWQVDVLSGLYALRQPLVIGLEMVPRSAQPALDAWVRGELDETTFLSKSGWRDFWRFDADLYLPILRFARLNRIPVYGLNVDKALVASVRERGWAALNARERLGIGDPARPGESYMAMLAESFAMHGAHGGGAATAARSRAETKADPAFQRFVESQLLWDRAMAERMAQAEQNHPGALVVGLMGSGHMMEGDGVPFQLSQLTRQTPAVLVPWDDAFGCDALTPTLADAVYGVASLPAAAASDRPRLGVRIEQVAGGVRVVEVVPNSVAQAAGFQTDDVLVSAAGAALAKPDDLIGMVQRMVPGSWLPVRVRRGATESELVAKFPAAVP